MPVFEGIAGKSERIVAKSHADRTIAQIGRIRNVARIVVRIGRTHPAAKLSGQDVMLYLHALRSNVIEFVVFDLLLASTISLANGGSHRIGDLVGIHYDQSVHVSGSTACRLGQGTSRPQEALLIGIENGYERH